MSEVDPGEGWYLLDYGAKQEESDEFFSRRSQSWRPVHNAGLPVLRGESIRRRKITVTTSGPYIAIEVHRAALAEIERLKAELDRRCEIWRIARDIAANERDAAESEVKRLKAELDAVKQPQPKPEPEWFDLTPFDGHVLRRDVDWVVYTDSEKWQIVGISRGAKIGQVRGYIAKARCLLKDAPPELVAKANKPAEDPDEWVTQDRVPARPLIDERRWVNQSGKAYGMGWVTVGKGGLCDMKHGDVSNGDCLELRCRRRDLPPMPEKPKTETVTFHEVVIRDRYQMQLCWVAKLDQFHIPTGRTETREVVR